MRKLLIVVTVATLLAWTASAFAALPYYNQNLGYTIWLADEWVEAPDAVLSGFNDFHDGVSADMVGWKAGYTLKGESTSLLVSEIQGRVVSRTSISNFNHHVVRQLKRRSKAVNEWQTRECISLKCANFDSRKNMLRLEMEASGPAGHRVTSIVYIVYTSVGMLKFVGLAEPGDHKGIQAIDKAVASLYFHEGLRR